MDIAFIILLIVIGIALLIVEVVVLPGVTVAGIGGLFLIGCSVFLTFRWHPSYGIYALVATCILFLSVLVQ